MKTDLAMHQILHHIFGEGYMKIVNLISSHKLDLAYFPEDPDTDEWVDKAKWLIADTWVANFYKAIPNPTPEVEEFLEDLKENNFNHPWLERWVKTTNYVGANKELLED